MVVTHPGCVISINVGYTFSINLFKVSVTDLDGSFKNSFNFAALNMTSVPQNNIAYTTNHRDFLESTSKKYFNVPYTFGYEGCCWQTTSQVDLSEPDSDSSVKQHVDVPLEFKMIAKVFDVNNVAPRVVLPLMWYINIGCDSSLELHPYDQDKDDDIKCRLANENEAGSASLNDSDHTFITLVSETCRLEFDADKFRIFSQTSDWSKRELSIPIAIMIEDFHNDTILSSMPIQFLVATMPASDTAGDDVTSDEIMESTERIDCDIIPVLSSIKDLLPSSNQIQESGITRSFDIYEGGRNENHCTFFEILRKVSVNLKTGSYSISVFSSKECILKSNIIMQISSNINLRHRLVCNANFIKTDLFVIGYQNCLIGTCSKHHFVSLLMARF